MDHLPTKQAHSYVVMVEDNFHHMDEEERYRLGEFDGCAAAVTACKKVVDDYLLDAYEPGMTFDQLWSLYTGFGDDPFIVTTDKLCRFSGWYYARQRCEELCRPQLDEYRRTT